MKHEVGILLKALHGVYADDELTKAERGEVVADVLDDYADRTGGRDGLKDIASIPAAIEEPDLTKADTRHALAMAVLEGKAVALRKVNPSLSREQAFSRVYSNPTNAEVTQIERAASHARFAEQAAQHGEGLEKNLALAKRDAAYAALQGKGEELRKADPSLTREGAIREGDEALSRSGQCRAVGESVGPVRRLSNSMLPLLWGCGRSVESGGGGTYPAAGAIVSFSGFDDGDLLT